jgi:hypothetical protein
VRSSLGHPSPRAAWPADAGVGDVDLASPPCGSEVAGICDGDHGGNGAAMAASLASFSRARDAADTIAGEALRQAVLARRSGRPAGG